MARVKKTVSREVMKAEARMNGSKSIDIDLDLGGDLKMAGFQTVITANRNAIEDYNTTLSSLDQKLNLINSTDKAVREYSQRWLNAVGSKYGYDSDEYEMAGGTRKSERKKPVKKKDGEGQNP